MQETITPITTVKAALAEIDAARREGRRPNLRGANLQDAYLMDVDLRGADLRGADLRYANLRGADLRDTLLRGANLQNANLRYVDLRGADVRDTVGGVLYISDLPSGGLYMVPTPDGWQVTVGFWPDDESAATLDDLDALIDAIDEDWTVARGNKGERRESILRTAHTHAAYHAHLIDELADEWGIDAC